MNHSFNVEIAVKYGILEAILLENIRFWTAKNRANGTHFYDGRYWIYNSARAFKELFPYATENKIRNALSRLVNAGILQTGNYNKMKLDRTLWYALTDEGLSIFQNLDTILQNQQMHLSKMQNGCCENDRPIPIINTDIKPVINNSSTVGKSDAPIFDDESVENAFRDWLCYKAERKEGYKQTGLKALITRLKREVSERGPAAVVDAITNSMGNGWKGIYFPNGKPKQETRESRLEFDLEDIFEKPQSTKR